ncbi:MAG TPA: nucleotide exchange factor GrpE [Candidatus Binatia bacterium]|nr:nucleotide exchange factor GrpE [Candidatus Binatia bacterium]
MSEEFKKDADESGADESNEAPPQEIDSNSVEAEFLSLRQQLETKETEAKNYYERLLRQAAELENYKKRSARERDDAIRYANESLLKDLLPVVDNLERAIAHASGGGNGKPLVEGVEMVLRGLADVLAKHGAMPILAQGQPFDPTKHEAMTQVETDDHEPNSVVEELHKGYMLRDRLLRPALVSVAKAVKTREKKNPESKVENGQSDD